jgi:membrane-bound ClpP family serine protease
MKLVLVFLFFMISSLPVNSQYMLETFNRYNTEEVDGKTVMYINGQFGRNFGMRTIRELYEKKPDVVVLDSLGGMMDEMMMVARYIERNNISLKVEKTCLSACAYMLFFSNDVTIDEDAVVGFHAPFTFNVPTDKTIEQLQRDFTIYQLRLIILLLDRGIPPSFTQYLLIRTSRENFAFLNGQESFDEIRDGIYRNLTISTYTP